MRQLRAWAIDSRHPPMFLRHRRIKAERGILGPPKRREFAATLLHVRYSDSERRARWAAYLRAARGRARLSQSELARRTGVNRMTIVRWEAGRFTPDKASDVLALSRAVDVDPDEALAAAGFRPDVAAPPKPKEPPLDPDVKILLRKLADPNVADEQKHLIRAQLRYLAELADQLPERPARRRSA